jgi:hypothetical protein
VTFYALDDLYANDRESARTRLANHITTLQGAYRESPLAQFRDDQVVIGKLISLTENLGRPQSFSDSGGTVGYATYTMNAFGQTRGGFVRARGPGF